MLKNKKKLMEPMLIGTLACFNGLTNARRWNAAGVEAYRGV